MSQVDQKRAYNKLKHDLEPWRNLIVRLDEVLKWENKFYPAIMWATISIFFLILWAIDLSTVTMLSLLALTAVIVDFVYPSVSRFLFSPDNWSGNQEARFEEVCNQLCTIKMALEAWYEYLFTVKDRKSTMFFITITVLLLALAWIGAVVNNFLLMYFFILTLIMYPGIQEKSVLNMIKERFGCVLNSKIQQLREKAKKAD